MKECRVGDIAIGDGTLTIIAGPCLAESESLCLEVAGRLRDLCRSRRLPYVFKASFDKANRSSGRSARGSGMEHGLSMLQAVKSQIGVPVTTDIHLPDQAAPAAEVADLLQIPAFLCRQTDLLEAAANTGKPVNVKKGQFLAPWDMRNIVDKLEAFGASGILLTERGTTFGYNNLVVDMPGLQIMRELGRPVCFDATHSAQRPGARGASTGGARDTVPAMTRAAVAVGVDALFIEVHPRPDEALSDRETQWPLSEIEALLDPAVRIHEAARQGPMLTETR